MSKFLVRVERTYTARHYLVYRVEAEDQEAADAIVDDALESGELDPTEEPYDDTNEDSGYDDVSAWCRVAGEQSPLNAVDFPADLYPEED